MVLVGRLGALGEVLLVWLDGEEAEVGVWHGTMGVEHV